jgi:hypothetical protein
MTTASELLKPLSASRHCRLFGTVLLLLAAFLVCQLMAAVLVLIASPAFLLLQVLPQARALHCIRW